jgi:hypothetical protein
MNRGLQFQKCDRYIMGVHSKAPGFRPEAQTGFVPY